MNIFIDTNVYLSLYKFSRDYLESLRILTVLIKEDKINLWITDQVIAEFARNREAKIKEALGEFDKNRLNSAIPNICKESDEEFNEIRKAISDFDDARRRLRIKLDLQIERRELQADRLIQSLFNHATTLQAKRRDIRDAWVRSFRGDPPGKVNSSGDAINWICLLKYTPNNEDIWIITEDTDYQSKLDATKLSPVLRAEWKRIKSSKIYFHKDVTGFFSEKFPDVKLAAQLEKSIKIEKLSEASTFRDARLALSGLSKLSDFTSTEIREIVAASTSNNQIYWLNDEPRVRNAINSIVSGHERVLDPTIYMNWVLKFCRKIIRDHSGADGVYEAMLIAELGQLLKEPSQHSMLMEKLQSEEFAVQLLEDAKAKNLEQWD